MKRFFSIAVPALIFLLFTVFLNSYRWIASGLAVTAVIPSPLLFVSVFVAAMVADSRRRNGGSRVRHLVPGMSLILAITLIYSVAEGAMQFLYARPLIPASDVSYVRGGLLLLFPRATATVTALTPVVIGVILAIAYGVARAFMAFLQGLLMRLELTPLRVKQASLIGLAVSFLAVFAVQTVVSADRDSETWTQSLFPVMARGFTSVDRFELAHPLDHDGSLHPERTESGPTADAAPVYGLPGIRDVDIYVFAIESYGITIFDNEDQREAILPLLLESHERLSADGFHVASHFLESPVFSGLSWLAEATFLTGNVIDRQSRFERLIEEGAFALPDFLAAEADYFAMKAKPGAVHGEWPEGYDVFGFNEMLIAYRDDFAYRGPWFSFVPVPDQFAIHALHRRIQERISDGTLDGRPLFAYYQLVSSHIPFNHIPEYLYDWDALGDGSVFFETENLQFDNDFFSGTEYVEGFIASVEYVLTVLTEYLIRFLPEDRDSLIIWFGDHQPGSVVSGRGASRSVPIHVISRDASIVSRFVDELGYVHGIVPDQPHPHPHMARFFPDFVQLSSQGSPDSLR